jgi:hypothetical protein
MATAGDDELQREAREVPRKWFVLAAVYAAFAIGCACVVPFGYQVEHPGASIAYGTVVAIEKRYADGDPRIVTRFVDVHGRERTTDDGMYMAPGARVGDTLPVIYDADGDWVRLVGNGERTMRWLFLGSAIVVGLLAAGCAAFAWRRLARNRWLLVHGARVPAQALRLQWRSIGRLPPLWRLSASWRDERAHEWREVAGDWQPSMKWQPAPDGVALVALVDPERPSRAWLPVSRARVEVAKA